MSEGYFLVTEHQTLKNQCYICKGFYLTIPFPIDGFYSYLLYQIAASQSGFHGDAIDDHNQVTMVIHVYFTTDHHWIT